MTILNLMKYVLSVTIFIVLNWASQALAANEKIIEIRLNDLSLIKVNTDNWTEFQTKNLSLHDLVFLSTKNPDKNIVISQKNFRIENKQTVSLSAICKKISKSQIYKNFCLSVQNENMVVVSIKILPGKKAYQMTSFLFKNEPDINLFKTQKNNFFNQGLIE